MATRQRRTRRRRLPPDEGRRVLLEAGRDHLYENPLGEPLDHVRITDIVDRLGLSIGADYHYWDSQDDYRYDLLEPRLQRYGDTAIVSYTFMLSADSSDGISHTLHNESRVLVRRDEAWQVVHVHKSPAWRAPREQP